MPYRKLLCAIDFSEHSRAAMTAAVELSIRFEASLTLLHVAPLPPMVPGIMAGQLQAQTLADVARTLPEWKRQAEELGAPRVETSCVPGVAWSQIVEAARQGGHDAVVVGTHGHSGLLDVLLGSVAERVVHHAPCTVVVVRRVEAAAT